MDNRFSDNSTGFNKMNEETSELVAKVPQVTFVFWIIKILATKECLYSSRAIPPVIVAINTECFAGKIVETFMNIRKMITLALVISAGAFVVAQAEPTEAQLTRQAVIKKAQAERIALARVPHGTIKSAELENERGKLVWSFDIATPGTPDITEVLVNAETGAIVTVNKETPTQQAAEAKADKQRQ
jgi:uncharacterized membrane protein YkoI